MPSIITPNVEGDVRLTWDPEKPEEVENARKHFTDLKDKGHIFFRLKDGKKADQAERFPGKDGELVCEFDPKADTLATKPVSAG